MRITLILLASLGCLACANGNRRQTTRTNDLTRPDLAGHGRLAIRGPIRGPLRSGMNGARPSARGQRRGGRGPTRGQRQGLRGSTGRGQRPGGRGSTARGQRPGRRGPPSWVPRRPGGRPLGRRGQMRNSVNAALGDSVERRQWLRMVDANITVRELAQFNRTKEFITLASFGRALRNSNISSAFSAYDFPNSVAAARVKINNTKVCLVFPISDFNAAINAISDRSTSAIVSTPDSDDEYTMKTDDKMTEAELAAFNTTSPNLYQICQGRRTTSPVIIDTTSAVQTGDDVTDMDPVTFLSINGKVTVYLKSSLSL
ncbi:uncharacterized protein [Haliotis asinina]|uniref:uncharacterized protein n=1 Tax=Haliotis asinina TaxID=109174 RepID=UPI0035321312